MRARFFQGEGLDSGLISTGFASSPLHRPSLLANSAVLPGGLRSLYLFIRCFYSLSKTIRILNPRNSGLPGKVQDLCSLLSMGLGESQQGQAGGGRGCEVGWLHPLIGLVPWLQWTVAAVHWRWVGTTSAHRRWEGETGA